MALVAMVIVLPTIGVLCTDGASSGEADGDSSGGADGDGEGHVYGAGGLKEAIQDLYAEIITSESDGGSGVGGDSSTFRLDDVASAKAKFVSDTLRRMIGNIDTTDRPVVDSGDDDRAVEWKLRSKQKEVIDAIKRYDETLGAEVSERVAKHVNWLMDRCVQTALDKNVPVDGIETTTAAVKQIKHDDTGAVQKCFDDLLDRFERLRMSDVTAVNCRGIYGHRTSTLSPWPSPTLRPQPQSRPPRTTMPPQTIKPSQTSKPPSPPQRKTHFVGRFKFKQFTQKQPRVEIAKAIADYQ